MNTQNLETKFIFLPKNIEIYKKNHNLLLKTNFGFVNLIIPKNLNIYRKNSFIYVESLPNDKKGKTWFFIFKNLLNGFSRQYLNRLILKGVGYKAFLTKNNIELKIGYSHSINYPINNSITVNIFKNSIVQINSPFKDNLGLVSSSLRSLKKVDIYKGKGILYKREKLNLKTGKKA